MTLVIDLVLILTLTLLQPVQSQQSICRPEAEAAGGQFGYSVALSQRRTAMMAVGEPWLSQVHIYTRTSQSDWQSKQVLADQGNGTYPRHAQSLFGYAVAMSEDAQWLAVGVPGRTVDPRPVIELQSYPYEGSVRLYRLSKSLDYEFAGELPNPNPSRFWDRFGSRLIFKESTVDNGHLWLFVTANAGWDGSSTQFYQGPLGTTRWPVPPVRDVSRAGVYVYRFNKFSVDIALPVVDSAVVSNQGLVTFVQFVPQLSSVPMGSLGLDFTVVAPPAGEKGGLVLLMRDYVIPEVLKAMHQDGFNGTTSQNLCPLRNCTYRVLNMPDGQKQVVNASGVVIEYAQSPEDGLFTYRGAFMQEYPTEPWLDGALVNGGHGTASWAHNTWFGVGIAAAYDARNDRQVMAVGAPRSSAGVYTFYRPGAALARGEATFNTGQFLVNENPYRRSFFGQRMAFSPDGRFLVVADPSGNPSQPAKGRAFLYYRASSYETLKPDALNKVVQPPLPEFQPGQPQSPYFMYKIAEFVRPPGAYAASRNGTADHFGFGMAVNQDLLVLSAPVDRCVYTYAMPAAIDVSSPVEPSQPTNYTIQPPPPGTTTNTDQTVSSQTWLYAGIGAALFLMILVPSSWSLIKRHHHKKTLLDLKTMEASFDQAGHGSVSSVHVQSSALFEDSSESRLNSREPLNSI